ncbi:MAG: hypothetical protein WJ289_10430 [Ferrovum myxofaciens]
MAFEIKLSSAPLLTKGFWSALSDLKPEKTFVIAPVTSAYPLTPGVEVIPATGLADCLATL